MTLATDDLDERRGELQRRLAELSPAKRALLERGSVDAASHDQTSGTSASTIPRRPPGVAVPMSFAQELVWVLERTNPGNTYNLSRLARIKGGLDVEALQRAVDTIVVRHEVLRTTFAEIDGEPQQLIHEPWPVPIARVDLRATAEAERDAEAVRLVRELTHRPFDLAVDLQLRTTLLQLAADDHVLLLESHHIATDGWSRNILLRELTTLYDGFRTGNGVELPELAIQYGDYAVWQRETLRGESLERLLGYWRRQLAGAPARLELPTDRARPVGPSFEGAKRTIWIPPALLEQLRRLSQEQGVTLYMTLLAAFDVLLSRYSGETEILVGSPVAGRTHPETHGVMGFFTNTLVLRTSLSGDPTVPELLRRVRDVCLGAHDHQELPFEKLVFDLQREHGGRAPLLQATFTLHDPEHTTLQMEGATVVPFGIATTATKFDLSLFTEESPRGLRTAMEYRTDLFDADTVDRILTHYRTLLESMVRQPGSRASQLTLLPSDEYAVVVGDGKESVPQFPCESLVTELVAEQAAKTPHAVAIEAECGPSDTVQLSYAELETRSNQLAWELRRMGVGPDVAVALVLGRTPSLIVAMLGVLKAGGAYLPLDPGLPQERLRFMLEDVAPAVVVTEDRLRERVPPVKIPQFVLDREHERLASHPGDHGPDRVVGPENLAYVLFTSGSTGRPKAVMVPHRAIAHHTQWIRSLCPFGASDTVLQKTPVTFDPSGLEIFLALTTGARLFLARPEGEHDLEYVLETMRRRHVTMVIFIPSALAASVDLPGFAEACTALRLIICGGEVLTAELARRALACAPDGKLYNLYGPTEATIAATAWEARGDEESGPLPIGSPVPDVRAFVLDQHQRPVPIGVAGELCLAGVQTARGYLNRPETTAERFVPDPFAGSSGGPMYRTGDRVRWRRDRVLEFLGRLDAQVKIRGYRIEPDEIASVLAGHDALREAAVVVREDTPGNQRLVAYVTVAAGHDVPTTLELREYARRSLPEYMVPSTLMVLGQLPLSANGKIDRDALPVPNEAETGAEFVAPRTDVERAVAEIWADVLGVSRVGVQDDFFDLGGHSLLALRMFGRLLDRLHVRLPLRTIFEAPTVAQLAARVTTTPVATAESDARITRRAGDQGPASFAQEVLWLVQRTDPSLSAYNMADAWWIEGPLNIGLLRRALRALVERHEALRTTFHQTEAGPIQRIEPVSDLAVEIVDLRATAAADREAEVSAIVRARARLPFDLAADPLLRATVIQLGDDRYMLTLVTHHIVSDGWSRGLMIGELSVFYDAFLGGVPPALAPLPIRLIDYAAWQRERLRGEALQQQLDYWADRLAGAAFDVAIPADRPQSGVQEFTGASRVATFPPAVRDSALRVAREHNATLYMVLLAAFQTLLHRYGQQDDVVVGTVVAGRSRADLEGLIGYFVNTLAIRTTFDEEATFADVLDQVREDYLAASENAEVPFQQVAQCLPRGVGRETAPVCQTMFVLQNNAPTTLHLGSASVRAVGADLGAARFDLSLAMSEQASGLRAAIQYRTERFDAETIDRLLRHFGVLLSALTEAPDTPVRDLPLLTKAEELDLRSRGGATAVAPIPAPRCMHVRFEEQAARTPDAVAATCEGISVSYGDLNCRANRLAHRLQKLGVGPDVLVGLCAERSIDLVVGLLGIMKAGGAYLPLDPSYPADRLAFMLDDAVVPVLVSQSAHAGRFAAASAKVVALDDDASASGDRAEHRNPVRNVEPHHLAYVIYTSGSTGRPKGVQITHQNVSRLFDATAPWFHFDEHDVWTLFHSFAFDFSVWELWGALIYGGRLVVVPYWVSRSPDAFLELLERERVTVLNQTPSAFYQLMDVAVARAGDLALRTVVFGGEALDPSRLRPWFDRFGAERPRLINMYGITETTVHVTYRPITLDDVQCGSGSVIGSPIPDLSIALLDRRGHLVPTGVAGEIYVSGAGVALGYLNRPELTAERFVSDPMANESGARMYRTGDRARWLADGTLEYLGRVDQQIKLRGHRIEPGEIEAVLMEQPGVAAAMALVREDAPGDQRLVAYVVPAAGSTPSGAELRAQVRQRLPAAMVPAAIVFLDRFPLTPNGKVDRRALPAPSGESRAVTEEYIAPRTPLESEIAAVWATALGLERVGVNDDFFDLGGDSLLAMRMIVELERVSGHRLSFRSFFEQPTIARAVSVLLSAGHKEGERTVAVLQEGGPGTPLVFVHGDVLGQGWYCRRLAPLLGPAPLIVLPTLAPRDVNSPTTIEAMAGAHLDTLRTVQPHGPYRLGGYCFGGLIAYEMARMLVSAGEVVEHLVLVDSSCGNVYFRPFEPLIRWLTRAPTVHAAMLRRARMHRRFRYYQRRLLELRRTDFGDRMRVIMRLARRAVGLDRRWQEPAPARSGDVPPLASATGQASADVTLTPDVEPLGRFATLAQRAYMPARYSGRVDVIWASAEVAGCAPDFCGGWERAAGDAQPHIIAGNHLSIVLPEGLPALAAQVRACLESNRPGG